MELREVGYKQFPNGLRIVSKFPEILLELWRKSSHDTGIPVEEYRGLCVHTMSRYDIMVSPNFLFRKLEKNDHLVKEDMEFFRNNVLVLDVEDTFASMALMSGIVSRIWLENKFPPVNSLEEFLKIWVELGLTNRYGDELNRWFQLLHVKPPGVFQAKWLKALVFALEKRKSGGDIRELNLADF